MSYESDSYLNNLKMASLKFLDKASIPILYVNSEGVLLYINRIGKKLFDEFKINTEQKVPYPIKKALKDKSNNTPIELNLNEKLYSFSLVWIKEEKAVFFYGSDITEKRRAEKDLKELDKIIDETINIVYITDYEGTIEYVNKKFEEVTGYSKQEALGKNPRILASGETKLSEYKYMWQEIKKGNTWRGLLKNKKKDGTYYWVNGFISPIRDENDNITNFLAIQEDITEKIAVEKQLNYLAEFDTITGMFNREHFLKLLDDYLNNDNLKNEEAALLQINIDGFKLINDSFGHSVGDRFLKAFADYLEKQIEELDIITKPSKRSLTSRLGSDEFAIFIVSKGKNETIKLAENLRKNIEEHAFLNNALRVTVSIGISLFPEHGTSSNELLSKSSAAISHAREQGRNRYLMYREDDAYFENVESVLEEKQLIIKAIEEERFVPWFQPILDLSNNEISHVEALARLKMPDGEVLSPAAFIPTAERHGLISEVDKIITKKAIKMQSKLMQEGKIISFSMNLSGKYFEDEEMFNYLQDTIYQFDANPEHIIFEITETAAISNLSNAVSFVKKLKDMGCKFSLDDFGVGYTSFVHLIEMNVDYLKIDGTFIKNLPESKRNKVLVKTILDMSKSLDIKTVAEFVDREKTIEILRELGVDYAQGYFIGKPSPSL
ncbi:GGDEF domain-containing phosphodiesterase [Natranaerofaba carboxydovora]|uniref:GGDEF domain-containing phosphodiesterase n=1 Tax=Natranaerofaba carboxydovora TaxID=2742683 RepID=UPI001F12FC04|nr:GGDEF domain-containing phosphodiesterase [Natranaerofaba carboxydovora]UMZ73643.1 Cyclic di-GMP phosphodiesterase PdeB [Natranaerofaba carboxydovora]